MKERQKGSSHPTRQSSPTIIAKATRMIIIIIAPRISYIPSPESDRAASTHTDPSDGVLGAPMKRRARLFTSFRATQTQIGVAATCVGQRQKGGLTDGTDESHF